MKDHILESIIIVGHGASPARGSEPGQTWKWAWFMKKYYDVTLICHPVFSNEINEFLLLNKHENFNVEYVDMPNFLDPWRISKKQIFLKIHYLLWQIFATIKILAISKIKTIKLVHQVSWSTVSVPSVFWITRIPLVWGPVGGGHKYPLKYKNYLKKTYISEFIRNMRIDMLQYNPILKLFLRKMSVILVSNLDTMEIIKKFKTDGVYLFMDAGVECNDFSRPSKQEGEIVNLLWVGRIEEFKGLEILIEALSESELKNYSLKIVGDGPKRKDYENLVEQKDLSDKVCFMGSVDWMIMDEIYSAADIFIFTSLRDSFGVVILEASLYKLPIIAFDHQGVATFVPDGGSIKIDLSDPKSTVNLLAKAIEELVSSPEKRELMGEEMRQFAIFNSWPRKIAAMHEIYKENL